MEKIRYTLYITLAFLLGTASGCSNEEMVHPTGSGRDFTIRIAGEENTTVLTRAEVIEKVTVPLHLFIYSTDATGTAVPAFYKEAALDDATETTIKCRYPEGMDPEGTYDIYVVGCEDGAAAGLSAATTKSSLLALTQGNIGSINAGTSRYMLAGVTRSVTLAPSPTVQIYRDVCRLDLKLTNESGNQFKSLTALLTAPDRTFVFRSDLRGTGLDNTFPDGVADTTQTVTLALQPDDSFSCSAFFFEKMTTAEAVLSDADKVKLVIRATRVDNTEVYFLAYLNANGGNTTHRNTIYEVDGKLKDGDIDITTTVIPWYGTVDDTKDVDPAFPAPKANSYLLQPGKTIYIPVSQANDASAANATIKAIAEGENLTAELVWTDVLGADSGKGLATDASVAEIQVMGSGPEALLKVKAGTKPGNSVVAVRDKDGKIKWSWHIWVTDYDPEMEAGQKTFNGYIFMDRNLGAMSAEVALNNANGAIGNYYQWGRKDPFPSKSWGTAALSLTPVYKADGTATSVTGAAQADMGATVQQPFVFCNVSGGYLDVAVATAIETWGSSGEKTAFDPCPPGWRVPERDAYLDINTTLIPAIASAGFQEKHCGFFPYTWNINKGSAAVQANSTYAFLWTASAVNRSTAYDFHNISVVTNDLGHGFPVRCVRDWTKGKLENEVRVMSIGSIGLSTGHMLGTSSTGYSRQLSLPLLTVNFGPGEKMNAIFKYYNYNGAFTDAAWQTIIELLDKNDIDVIYICNPSLTAVGAQLLKQWVDAKPNRVLIGEHDGGLNNLMHLQYSIATDPVVLSNYSSVLAPLDADIPDADFYNRIVDGPYGPITNKAFANVATTRGFIRAELIANGFVPILQVNGAPAYTSITIHPQSRVVFYCDNGFFHEARNANGSLAANSYGQYSLLWANIWAWIAQTALIGR